MIGSINTYSFAQTGGSAAAKQADSTGGATETPRVQGDVGAQSANTRLIIVLCWCMAWWDRVPCLLPFMGAVTSLL